VEKAAKPEPPAASVAEPVAKEEVKEEDIKEAAIPAMFPQTRLTFSESLKGDLF
jgi:hypothetical protein